MTALVIVPPDELRALIRDEVGRLARTQHEPDRWLNTQQIAALLAVSPRSIATLVRRDGLPVRKVAGRYRASRDQIDAWVRERPRANGARSLKLAK